MKKIGLTRCRGIYAPKKRVVCSCGETFSPASKNSIKNHREMGHILKREDVMK